MGGEHAVTVGPDHGALEPGRHRELRHHHGEESKHEHHGEQGEAALISHEVVTGKETTRGGCSTGRPAWRMVRVTSMEKGRIFAVAPSH